MQIKCRSLVAVLRRLVNHLQGQVGAKDFRAGWNLRGNIKSEQGPIRRVILSDAGVDEGLAAVVVVGSGANQRRVGNGIERDGITAGGGIMSRQHQEDEQATAGSQVWR